MRITLIQPAIGHRIGEAYIRSWQMEPLPIATLAGLTPASIDLRFYDDRMETIPFDEPTDAVAIPVETYTAHRAYQIASEYRQRGVPVILGGFHPTLVPQEASRFAEAIVIGEAEAIWPEVVDDLRHNTLKRRYRGERTDLSRISVDRKLFQGKHYLPIGLVETGRGCRFPCEFCAIQTFFERSYRSRPASEVIRELESLKNQKKLFFFVDDNFAGDIKAGKELLPEIERLKLRWITQVSINAAHDEAFVQQLARSGCRGVLIGFESLNESNLRLMNKRFNMMKSGYVGALDNLRRHGIAVYGTFVFGYEHDNLNSFGEAVEFAIEQDMYVAAFNHLTPFPGTPLYQRLEAEGRLRFQAWWLDKDYRYNELPFTPQHLTPAAVTRGCIEARRRFYAWPSILKRSLRNRSDFFMLRNFFPINALHRNEISLRNGYPLGDETCSILLREAA
jgi:radical SAM superfamily enzyme YgiQ (UPF0313 family)